ncbi:MAG: MsnO8 family LLM class oxidoreductase [Flavobacteriia bacterium]|nr:MsnO8 family LLM class oxidoreductase [Flavobacteriia bacterium]
MLDLAVVSQGKSFRQTFDDSVAIAQLAEQNGYKRYWLAEHHNMDAIGSSATAILIGKIAEETQHIRVGSGGIMLPNHSPLIIAEQFGTLGTLYPNRIDLGLGRAPKY